jgi:hypothetical protein
VEEWFADGTGWLHLNDPWRVLMKQFRLPAIFPLIKGAGFPLQNARGGLNAKEWSK